MQSHSTRDVEFEDEKVCRELDFKKIILILSEVACFGTSLKCSSNTFGMNYSELFKKILCQFQCCINIICGLSPLATLS